MTINISCEYIIIFYDSFKNSIIFQYKYVSTIKIVVRNTSKNVFNEYVYLELNYFLLKLIIKKLI